MICLIIMFADTINKFNFIDNVGMLGCVSLQITQIIKSNKSQFKQKFSSFDAKIGVVFFSR
jgi:hypothetical protein